MWILSTEISDGCGHTVIFYFTETGVSIDKKSAKVYHKKGAATSWCDRINQSVGGKIQVDGMEVIAKFQAEEVK